MNLNFAKPEYLVFLAVIPILIFFHFLLIKRQKRKALKFANFEAISRIEGADLLSKNIFLLFFTCLLIIMAVFVLAEARIERILPASEVSFVLAIDSSRSMEANDYSPNRIEAAKKSAINFIENAPPGTKIAIVSFSGNSFIEQSLTEDKVLLRNAVNRIQISAIGGTDLADAVITSSNLLENFEAKSVILISDGRINVGTIDDAISYANKKGVVVHTIAIGTEEGGDTSYGISKVDKDSLRALSYETRGEFYDAINSESIEEAYKKIINIKIQKVNTPISKHLIVAIIFLIIIQYILFNTRYRILP